MKLTSILLTAGLLAFGSALSAQAPAPEVTKTAELRNVEIINVSGNVVTFDEAGVVKQWTAPEGFLFNVDGKQVPVSQLQPGTMVTALVYTKTVTIPASRVVTVKSATVVKASGPNVIAKMQDGTYKSFMVKKGTKFMVDGKLTDVSELRPGMVLTQKIITTTKPESMTEQQIATAGTAPAPKAAPAPAPAPAPAAAPAPAPAAKKLPKTGSNLPLVGLFGALLLAIGAGLTLRRNF